MFRKDDETYFCWEVTKTNKLELLKWAREEKECEWDYKTINTAAYQGNLEMVQYCVANQCPMDGRACAYAAESGHLEVLKYLHEEVKAPWGWRTAFFAAKNGHLHILEYLFERKYDKYSEAACVWAAQSGHLDCLKYLHETAKAPWNSLAVREAHRNNHSECLQYLLDNDCPLPTGWSLRRRNFTHVLNTCSDTQREREREREITREREILLPKKQERSCEKRDTPSKNYSFTKTFEKKQNRPPLKRTRVTCFLDSR